MKKQINFHGITVFYKHHSKNNASDVNFGIFTGYGMDKNKPGIAHLYEHCMFLPSKVLSEQEITEFRAKTCPTLNARTSSQFMEITFYESSKDLLPYELLDELKDNVCVLTGQSGVGKSTLLNQFDSNLNIKTNEISQALGRGKHTTRHVELLSLGDGYLADTPGFGTVDFTGIDAYTLSQQFREFFEALPNCKYGQCLHINEPNCEVKRKIENNEILKSRYENYLLFVKEIQETKKKY